MNLAVNKAKTIMSSFPLGLFSHCFCYGSAVFRQTGKQSSPMIDLIFVVNNSLKFHEENLAKHSWHYSAIKYLGPSSITRFQQQWSARVFYNTLIHDPEQNVTYKYGVIARDDFVTDLLDWCYLYMAGRLHKPVAVLHQINDHELSSALKVNLHSAIHAALLMLPETFTEIEFYRAIANLSYSGDFRMWIGEDKNKVTNIVTPQVDYFREMYLPAISTLGDFLYAPEGAEWRQNVSPEARWHHLNNLPRTPQKELVKYFNRLGGLRRDTEEMLQVMSYDPDVGVALNNCLRKVVLNSSIKQSMKSMVTAGIVKTMRYSSRKIYKTLISLY